jgi:uncharacterized protein
VRPLAAALVIIAVAGTVSAETTLGGRFSAAIERGDIMAIKALVEDGADPDTPMDDDARVTPLMKAAGRGKRDIVKYLLAKGAKVNAADAQGQTALMQAVTFGFDDIVELLVAAGADVKVRDTRGNSVFSLASAQAHLEIADILLKHGADVNEVDSYGITPLLAASSLGNEEVITYLVGKGAKVNAVTQLQYGGSTALTTAASVGQVGSVKALLALGADPRLTMKDGGTALSHAQESKNEEVIALIRAALAKGGPAPKR